MNDSPEDIRQSLTKLLGPEAPHGNPDGHIDIDLIASPLGTLVAGANTQGAVLLEFTDEQRLAPQFKALRRYFKCALLPGENAHLKKLRAELAHYFDGKLECFSVPLIYPGTEFQQKVWNALQTIPYGQTWSYEALARHIGAPAAVRAVGTCNGLNRIAILIPCHRVVGKDGRLTGYGGGLWRKQALLDLERGVRGLDLAAG
jgi:AraC family transcriptional regulator of adaptative response/methylated-DNA-[protein]-cysteine methyltransferase